MTLQEMYNRRNELITQAREAQTVGDLVALRTANDSITTLDTEITGAEEAAAETRRNEEAEANRLSLLMNRQPAAQPAPVDPLNLGIVDSGLAPRVPGAAVTDEVRAFGNFMRRNNSLNNLLRRPSVDSNNTETAGDNAIIIPETVRDQIYVLMQKFYPVLAKVPMTFIRGNVDMIIEGDSGPDASWYMEDEKVIADSRTAARLSLGGHELAKAIRLTWKLQEMSIEQFIPYIIDLIARKMGAALAKGFMYGIGVPATGDTSKPQPVGAITALKLEASTPQIVTAAAAEPTYKEMTKLFAKIYSGFASGAELYANNIDIWESLANIVDGMGRPMFVSDPMSGGVGRLFGVTVQIEDSLLPGEILLANFAEGYTANTNRDVTLHREDKVLERYTNYMGYMITDGKPKTTKAFALLKVPTTRAAEVSARPESVTFSKAAPADVTFAVDGASTISAVKIASATVNASNYTIVGNTVTFSATYLGGLTNGNKTVSFVTPTGTPEATIVIAA